MNCVGIDVSKGKSMIAVMRPFGEVEVPPFEVQHTDSELSGLEKLLKQTERLAVDIYAIDDMCKLFSAESCW